MARNNRGKYKYEGISCAVEDCDRQADSRGWCTMHYQRWLRHGDPLITKKAAVLPNGEAAKRRVIISYRHGAKVRGIEMVLTDDEIISLSQLDCYYCGAAPSQVATSNGNTGDFLYNGIDRIDNSRGYELENVVPCCWQCNRWKRSMSKQDFLEHVTRIFEERAWTIR